MKGGPEYVALLSAMDTANPACRADDTWIADELEPDEIAHMQRICQDCPLLALCDAYATAGKPAAGYWAGRNYNRRELNPRRKK